MAGSKKDDIEVIAEKLSAIIGAPKSLERPPGTITSSEYAKITKISVTAANAFLKNLVDEGKAKRYRFGNAFAYELLEDNGKE
jgi:Fic family protein